MPYGITQCYLPPGRGGDIPAFTPAANRTVLYHADTAMYPIFKDHA